MVKRKGKVLGMIKEIHKHKIQLLWNIILAILGAFCICYYLYITVLKQEMASLLYVWPVIGLAFLCKASLWWGLVRFHRKWLNRVFLMVDGLILLFLLSVILFFSGIIYGMNHKTEEDVDYVVILGAAISGNKPSYALQKRIDTAYDYLNKHPHSKAIACGGMGAYATISEGDCTANELERMGIDKNRILIERTSTTTVENLRNAQALFTEQDPSIAIVTSNFHVFRATVIMSAYTGHHVKGIPAEYKGVLCLHYMLREYVTFGVDLVHGNII
jgi:uncharacterized SAM-binding protein YcdF (DUF218 family)